MNRAMAVALVLVRLGRHREPGVVGEQRHHGFDVAGLHCDREPLHDLALAFDGGSAGRLGRRGSEPFTERRPRPLERGLHRGLGAVQDGRDLVGAQAEHVAQHEHAPLARWQVLQGRDERERDGLRAP